MISAAIDDVVPLAKALMAAAAVREGPGEATGADIAAWPRNSFDTDAVAADFVTLLR